MRSLLLQTVALLALSSSANALSLPRSLYSTTPEAHVVQANTPQVNSPNQASKHAPIYSRPLLNVRAAPVQNSTVPVHRFDPEARHRYYREHKASEHYPHGSYLRHHHHHPHWPVNITDNGITGPPGTGPISTGPSGAVASPALATVVITELLPGPTTTVITLTAVIQPTGGFRGIPRR